MACTDRRRAAESSGTPPASSGASPTRSTRTSTNAKPLLPLSLSIEPIVADTDLHHERDTELCCAFHLAPHHPRHRVHFRVGRLQDQLVVHLQEHRTPGATRRQCAMQADHGDLYQ